MWESESGFRVFKRSCKTFYWAYLATLVHEIDQVKNYFKMEK